MCPADAGYSDTHVITSVIKEIAQTHTLDPNSQRRYKGEWKEHMLFVCVILNLSLSVVVLNEVDRLSQQAQNALRRTMEKYMLTCRIIMCCESSCRVIEPLRSRCLGIRVPAPEKKEAIFFRYFSLRRSSIFIFGFFFLHFPGYVLSDWSFLSSLTCCFW